MFPLGDRAERAEPLGGGAEPVEMRSVDSPGDDLVLYPECCESPATPRKINRYDPSQVRL